MAGLADDWKEQRQTCIDVLCGYMRLPYQPTPAQPQSTPGQPDYKAGRTGKLDLQSFGLVRDHLRKDAKSSWQGCVFRFHRVSIRRR